MARHNSTPVISSISSSATTTSAAITWTTSINANSEVVYGTTTAYGAASSSSSLVTSHSISLAGLATSTTYHYEVVSTSNGHTATSSDQTFFTGSTPAYAYRGSGSLGDPGNVETYSINMGAGSNYVAVVAVAVQNGPAINSVTVDGQSLTSAVDNGDSAGNRVAIWSGPVTSGAGTQNVVLTTATGAYVQRDIAVWTVTGLNSNTPKQTGSVGPGVSFPINVSAGDFLFAVSAHNVATNFSDSTAAPFEVESVPGISGNMTYAADWTIASTNSSFVVDPNGGTGDAAGVTLH